MDIEAETNQVEKWMQRNKRWKSPVERQEIIEGGYDGAAPFSAAGETGGRPEFFLTS